MKSIEIQSKTIRANKGMALASVLAFGIVIALFVTALLDTMLPILVKTTQFKTAGTARTFADLGLDYAVQQLNAGILNCASASGASVNWNVPTDVLNDPNASVNVTVAALPDSATGGTGNPPNTSILYDPLLNAQFAYSYRMVTVTSTYGLSVKQVRCLLEPLSNTSNSPIMPYGVFGISSVVFAGQAGCSTYNSADPRMGADAATLGKISQVSSGSSSFGRSTIAGGSLYEFTDPNTALSQQYGLGSAQYSAQPSKSAPFAVVTGNVYSNGSNNTALFAATGPADTLTASNTATWMNLSSQAAHNVLGVENGVANSGTIPSGYQNQFVQQASPPSWTGGLADWNIGPQNADGVTFPQPNITPAPTAPPAANNLGNINLNNATLIIDSTAPAPSGPFGTISNTTVRIPPASYTINSLSLSNNSSVQFTPATQAAISSGTVPPAAFYVSGSNNGSLVISVDNTSTINMNNGISSPTVANGFNTSGNLGLNTSRGTSVLEPTQLAISPTGSSNNVVETSGSAGQFQLYYAGSGFNNNAGSFNTQIILSGNQRMTLYAPATGVLLGSPITSSSGPSTLTNSSNYYGALVGGSVNLNSGYTSGGGVFVHYDMNLRPPGMKWLNPWQPPPTLMGTNFNGYRVVTWQEALQPNAATPSLATWSYQ